MADDEQDALVDGVRRGEKTAVARALNRVESKRREDREGIAQLLDRLERARGRGAGHRIGFTGPPGVGKSTLVSAFAAEARRHGRTVGIVAFDPSSLVSGGSLLGDRARMGAIAGDPGVFVRSYSTGGETGGVNTTALASVSVLAAAYDLVLVETVGVGQTETDVRLLVDTVVLVVQPGSGDTIQFLKAGIMEIPDIVVVQKADHDELAQRALADLGAAMRTIRAVSSGGTTDIPAIATSALFGRGIAELLDETSRHRVELDTRIESRRDEGAIAWAIRELVREIGRFGLRRLGGEDHIARTMRAARAGGMTAYTLAEREVARFIETIEAPSAEGAHSREPS